MKNLQDYLSELLVKEATEPTKPEVTNVAEAGDIEDVDVITESIEYFRFTPGDLKNGAETVDSVKKLADKAGIFNELVDGGIKMKLNADKEKYDSIQDVIQQFVDELSKAEDVDEKAVEKVAKQLAKLTDFIDSEEEPVEEPAEDGDEE